MYVRKGKPGCMIALGILVLAVLIAMAVGSIKAEQNEKKAAALKAEMSVLLEEGYRCGDAADKAVGLLFEGNDDNEGQFRTEFVPEEYKTETAAEVRYLIRRTQGSEVVGYYSRGGAGLKHKYTVEVVDLKTGERAEEVFMGGEPPMSVTVKDGKVKSHYGSVPDEGRITEWVLSVMRGVPVAEETTQAATEATETAVTEATETAPTEAATQAAQEDSKAKALKLAEEYLSSTGGYSPSRLEEMLIEFEGVTAEDARYAVENCGGDWVQEARECAVFYAELGFSYRNTYGTMCTNDQFAGEVAREGVDTCGADWKEAAVAHVQYEMEHRAGLFNRESLLQEMVDVFWFTEEEALYALDVCGIE